MAETVSTEWQSLYVAQPVVRVSRNRCALQRVPFTYTQLATGAANDTVLLQQLPALSKLDCLLSRFTVSGFTSGMTLSIGWAAYTDTDGVRQAASAAGIFSAAAISNGTGSLMGGTFSAATVVSLNPVVPLKDFRNSSPITIFATFGSQAPGAGAVLRGVLVYANA